MQNTPFGVLWNRNQSSVSPKIQGQSNPFPGSYTIFPVQGTGCRCWQAILHFIWRVMAVRQGPDCKKGNNILFLKREERKTWGTTDRWAWPLRLGRSWSRPSWKPCQGTYETRRGPETVSTALPRANHTWTIWQPPTVEWQQQSTMEEQAVSSA